LGLQVQQLNFLEGTLSIEQRSWHQNIDKPKTQKSKRKLAIAALTGRYQTWIAGLNHQHPCAWISDPIRSAAPTSRGVKKSGPQA
jgi:hypothetical protein